VAVRILVQKATIPSKKFSYLLPHMCCMCCKNYFCAIKIVPDMRARGQLTCLKAMKEKTKKKVLDDSKLCKFCLRHSADTECYGRGLNSTPACLVQECKGQHTEKLHAMMADLNASVNVVVDEQEEEEGCINVAR
jgi:hypothetical protein